MAQIGHHGRRRQPVRPGDAGQRRRRRRRSRHQDGLVVDHRRHVAVPEPVRHGCPERRPGADADASPPGRPPTAGSANGDTGSANRDADSTQHSCADRYSGGRAALALGDGDVGAPSIAGSATYSGGTYTVAGSGADIWGTSDQFRFVYYSLSGNATITAGVLRRPTRTSGPRPA